MVSRGEAYRSFSVPELPPAKPGKSSHGSRPMTKVDGKTPMDGKVPIMDGKTPMDGKVPIIDGKTPDLLSIEERITPSSGDETGDTTTVTSFLAMYGGDSRTRVLNQYMMSLKATYSQTMDEDGEDGPENSNISVTTFKDEIDYTLQCPHCGISISIPVDGVACGIFRCAVFKATNIHMNPHAGRKECVNAISSGKSRGCGGAFAFNGRVVKKCKYSLTRFS